MATITGSNQNDTLTGTATNDIINSGNGDDSVNGGAGSDSLNGGAGNDILDGGSGSDQLNGGSGNDTLIYNVSENSTSGTKDVYTGGSGTDIVEIHFTLAQWLESTTQTQIAAYLAHLAAVTNAKTGEVSNGSASDFMFTFGSSTLTVQMMESLKVLVDGVVQNPSDVAVLARNDIAATTEDGPSVKINVLQNDLVPDLVKALALASAPAHGTATLIQPDINNPSSWYFQYEANSAYSQYLAQGQTTTDTFTYTVTDADGDMSTATVTITLTGSNDGVSITSTAQSGAVTEDADTTASATDSQSATGAISFTDLDLADTHTTTFAAAPANITTLGAFALAPVSEAANAASGSVAWTYTLNNAAAQYLAAGETASETYTVTVDDGHGSTTTQDVVITVTGSNDAPTISVADDAGAVTEDSADPTLSDSGIISFSDVDLTDLHLVSASGTPVGSVLGSLTAVKDSDTTGAGSGGQLSWTYTVAEAAVEYLAAGQTKIESFTITLNDQHGGLISKQIHVTVTGTNDAPTISAAVDTGAVTEDGSNPTLSTIGTITFDDIDLIDGHSVSAAAAAGNTLGGMLVPLVTDMATGAGTGTVGWTYSVANAATQYLAAGETTTETFTITISDGETDTVTQDITITLTGSNDGVSITSTAQSGAVTEDADTTASATDSQSAAGTISFTDLDLADTHTTTFAAAPANTTTLGAFALAPVSEAANAASGSVAWTYTLNNAAAQYLAAGETASETYTVTVDDGHGSTTTQDVVITVTGSNDAPTISVADDAGAVTEDSADPTLSDSGTITFDDIDLSDAHTTSVSKDSGTLGGALLAVVSDSASGATDGAVTWTYSVANSATQHLGVGDTATETFTVTIRDGETGGTVSQLITVTVTGTNDAPVLTVDTGGGLTEDLAVVAGNLSDSGTLSFTDVDVDDAVSVTSVYNGDALWSTGGALSAAQITAITSGFTNDQDSWDYSVANAALQFLGEGESITLSFEVKATDDSGAGNNSDTETVTLTLTGTNDQPTLTIAGTAGTMDEGNGTATLSDSAALSFADLDSTDVVTVSHSANGDIVWSNGVLNPGVAAALVAGFSVDQDSWNYSSSQNLDFLCAGETITFSYEVVATDDSGAATAVSASQSVTITLTGTNDGVSITSAAQSGTVTEDADTTASATDSQSAAGTISFTDLDLADTHTTAFAAAPANTTTLGAFALAPVSEAANAASGSVAWTYTLNNAAAQYLAAGETASETYTVTVDDGHGSTTTQDIVITITGTNDAPTISVADDAGAVTEDGADPTLSDSGTISFDDLDLSDAHATSVSKDSGALGGALVALVSDSASGATEGAVTWSYSVANSATQYLGVGDTATETFTVTISDGESGGTVSQLITVTVTGTNDAPTISAAVDTRAVTEDVSNPTLSTVGTITFDDLDLIDGHSVSAAAAAGNTLGGVLTASVSDAATGAGDGTVNWNYSAANAATQYLAAGQTATENFTVSIADGHGGTLAQLITVTVTGANDAPVIPAQDLVGAVTEQVTPVGNLSDSGTLSFTDVDLSDVHLVSATGTPVGGVLGSLTAVKNSDTTGTGSGGQLHWTYTVADAAVEYLAAGQTKVESFTVTLNDQHGGLITKQIDVTITGTNDAPLAVADVNSGNEDTTITGTVATNDSDVDDGATQTYSLNAPVAGLALASNGSYSFNAGNAAYQHLAQGATAEVVANYTVTDQHGATSTSSLTVTLTGTNDAPLAVADVNSGNEDTTITGTVATNDSDVDDGATQTYSLNAPVAGLALTSNGSYSFNAGNAAYQHLAQGATADVVANYTVTDQHGATSTSTLTITLTGTNDAPVITVQDLVGAVSEQVAPAGNLSDSGTIAFTDVDLTDIHSVSAVTPYGGALGSLSASVTNDTTGTGLGGVVTWNYTVAASAAEFLSAGQTKVETFTFNVLDGHGGSVARTVEVTITGTNDAPVLNAAATPVLANVAEDAGAPSGAVGSLVSSLVDFNPPATGLNNVTDADNGALTGIALTSVNATNGSWWYSTNGGANWTAVGAVSNSSALLLAADANTRVYFQGNSNFNGIVSDGITFRAWDETSGTAGAKVSTSTNGGSSAFSSATDTASITVSTANDNPVAVADRIIVSNNTLVTIAVSALLANDTDIDGLALAITSVGSAVGISGLTLDAASGTISFTSGPTAGATAGSFQYTVSDGAGGATTATATIDIRTVAGGNTVDTIDLSATGTYQASFIDGRGGADILTGGAAGDIFIGGSGNAADTLTGFAGNDLLVGGDGNDTLAGGAGNDVLRGGIGSNDSMDGGAGSEDLLDFSDGSVAVNFTLVQSAGSTSIANGTGGLGNNDAYQNIEGVIGTSQADTLTGSASNDILRGGAGNDILDGAGGAGDLLDGAGGAGDLLDFSDGTAGLAFTLTQSSSNTNINLSSIGLSSATGDIYRNIEGVIGTAFADTLTGSETADQLRGGGGNDVINGLAGDDRIVGGSRADTLTGGADNDIFVFNSAPNAVDSITDFDASGSVASGDLIELAFATFTAIMTASGSTLSSTEFASSNGGGAGDTVGAGVHVIYDSATGNLYYDSNGLSAADRTLVATLTLSNPADTFDNNDIWIGL